MKLALDPSMYRDDLTLEETVYKTAELGYEYIELSPREDFCPFYKYPKVDSAKIKQLKRLLRDTGVKLSSLLPLYTGRDPMKTAGRQRCAIGNGQSKLRLNLKWI